MLAAMARSAGRWAVLSLALLSLSVACRMAPESEGDQPSAPVQAVHAAPEVKPAQEAEPLAAQVPDEPATEVAAELVEHRVTADDGHTLAVWSKVPQAPTRIILLIHGRTWSSLPDFDLQVPGGPKRSLMDALARHNIAAYAIDLRGYGKTARDETGFLTPDRAAADVVQTMQWIAKRHPDIGKPALFGWSLGSLVAQLAAQNQPELVGELVLYGYPRDPRKAGRTNPKAPKPSTRSPARRPTTKAAAAEDFRLPKYVHRQTVEAFSEAAVAADPVRMDWRAMYQFGVLDPAKVTVPTLVIHGRHDPYAPPVNQARLIRMIANEDRRWVVVPHGDHAAHLEQAHDYFVDALVGFLTRSPVTVVEQSSTHR